MRYEEHRMLRKELGSLIYFMAECRDKGWFYYHSMVPLAGLSMAHITKYQCKYAQEVLERRKRLYFEKN